MILLQQIQLHSPETDSETILPAIDIRNIVLNDVNLHYNDLSLKLNTVILNLSAKISGTITQDNISGNIKVKRSVISLEYDGEKYLQQASVQFDIPVDIIPSRQFISLKNARFQSMILNYLLNGSVENDTLTGILLLTSDISLHHGRLKICLHWYLHHSIHISKVLRLMDFCRHRGVSKAF